MFMRSLNWMKRSDAPKNVINESQQKPQSWVEDEKKIKSSSCSYNVEYLGYVEVFDSRGVIVCEKAIKMLKSQKSRCKKAMLYISGDAIRVVDEINKFLLVDQTLEKVSFCAPDRNVNEGFAYICRDATTKRWLCHGFLAIKESGDRISHALGCAFAVCLERKISRDKQTAVNCANKSKKDSKNSFKKSHFRQASLLDRIADPQITLVPDPVPVSNSKSSSSSDLIENNNYNIAIKRPRPVSKLYNKQLSLPASCHNNNDNNINDTSSNNSSTKSHNGSVYNEFNRLKEDAVFEHMSKNGRSSKLSETFDDNFNNNVYSSIYNGETAMRDSNNNINISKVNSISGTPLSYKSVTFSRQSIDDDNDSFVSTYASLQNCPENIDNFTNNNFKINENQYNTVSKNITKNNIIHENGIEINRNTSNKEFVNVGLQRQLSEADTWLIGNLHSLNINEPIRNVNYGVKNAHNNGMDCYYGSNNLNEDHYTQNFTNLYYQQLLQHQKLNLSNPFLDNFVSAESINEDRVVDFNENIYNNMSSYIPLTQVKSAPVQHHNPFFL